jgi:hypothetical protein
MKKLKRIFGIESWEEKMSRLPPGMPDEEKNDIIKIIEGFIHGNGGRYDWDWMITGPKESKEGELIGCFCSSLDSVDPPTEKGHFCSTEGLQRLSELLDLRRREESGSTKVFEFLEDFRHKAEPDATGQRR